MAFGNLFGKKKSSSFPVLTGRSAEYQYSHHYGERNVAVRYDPGFEAPGNRPSFAASQRIVVYLDPVLVDPSGLPGQSEKNRLRKQENNLIQSLEKAGVECNWVGTLIYEGMCEVVFMAQSSSAFRDAAKSWMKGASVYRVEALEGNGWEFYEKKIIPSGLIRHQVTDQQVMEQLRKAGSNMETGHWTEHLILGPEAILKQLAEEMNKEEFYIKEQEGNKLILEKCLKMEAAAFNEGVLNLRVRCDQLGLDYDGWETPVVRDAVLSGTIEDGVGSYIWATGLRYDGPWVGGKRTGKGHMKFKDGSQYIGDFQNDKRTGKGLIIWEWNEKYEGDFLAGECHGEGTYWWPSGNKYIGEWYYGDRHGKGKFWWGTGSYYEGDFVKNKRTGYGRFEWPDGDWYEGEFLEGKLHGKGREYIASRKELREGEYVEGTYKGGTIISSGVDHGKGAGGDGNESGHSGGGSGGTPVGGGTSGPSDVPGGSSGVPGGTDSPVGSGGGSGNSGGAGHGSIDLSKKEPTRLPELAWKILDDNDPELMDTIGREARFAAARGKKSFLFLSGRANGPAYDLRGRTNHPQVAEVFAKIQLIEAGGVHLETLEKSGFLILKTPCIFKLNPNGTFGDMQTSGFEDNQDNNSFASQLDAFFSS